MCSGEFCKTTTTAAEIVSTFDVDVQPSIGPRLIMDSDEYYISNEFIAIILLIMNFFGAITNGLTINTFIMMGLKNEVTFSFAILAVSDFCFVIANVVNVMSDLVHTVEMLYGFIMPIDPFVVWLYSTFVALAFYNVSTMITGYLAATRCICVALPFKFKSLITHRNFLIIISIFVVYSVTIHSLIYPQMGVHNAFDAKVNRTRPTHWLSSEFAQLTQIIRFCTLFSISLTTEMISFVCSFIMTVKLQASVQFRKDLDLNNEGRKEKASQKLTGKERHVVIQMIVISTIFFLCNLMQLIHALCAEFITAYTQNLFYLTMGKVQLFFNTINSSVNFFVYLKFNTRFRQLILSKIEKLK